MVSDIPITNQDGVAWKEMYKMKPSPVQKKQKKNDLISLSLWKNGRGLLFWNNISLKNTLKTKQNWQYWIYCLQLFCLRRPLFAPLPWKLQGYLSLQPFYNNVPFLTKQQRKYQVKPLPLSNDQVNSASVLQTAHAHSHVCPHAAMLLMRNVRFVSKISVFSVCVCMCVCAFFLDFLFFNGKGKGRWWFPIYTQDVGRPKKWLQAETLDGDRENWLRHENVWNTGQAPREHWIYCLYLDTAHTLSHASYVSHRLSRSWLLLCRNLENLMNLLALSAVFFLSTG